MMEARIALRGSGISKQMMAVVFAVVAAFLLGALGGYGAKAMSLPAGTSTVHVAVAQPAASGFDSAWNYSSRRGPQPLDGPAPADLATGRSGPQLLPAGQGAISADDGCGNKHKVC